MRSRGTSTGWSPSKRREPHVISSTALGPTAWMVTHHSEHALCFPVRSGVTSTYPGVWWSMSSRGGQIQRQQVGRELPSGSATCWLCPAAGP